MSETAYRGDMSAIRASGTTTTAFSAAGTTGSIDMTSGGTYVGGRRLILDATGSADSIIRWAIGYGAAPTVPSAPATLDNTGICVTLDASGTNRWEFYAQDRTPMTHISWAIGTTIASGLLSWTLFSA